MASYIKEAPHSERTAQADAHFDTAAFWRDMVIGLEEQNAALKAKVSRLEARIDELQGEETTWMQDNASPKLETSTRSQRLKRTMDRALEKDVSGTGSKRARILADPTLDESRSEWDELGNHLLHNLRDLQKSSTAERPNSLGPKNIADRLCTAANDICDHVSAFDLPGLFTVTPSSEQQAAAHLHTESEESKENRLVLIRKTFPHFLDHIHTLSQVSETAKLRQKVVYKFINIFRVLFERICDLAVINAKPDHHRPETTNKRDHGRKTQSAMSSSGERSATPPTVVKLCKLVITLLSNLDPTKPTHKEILEGYLYYLVTRVGKALESFTIGGRPYGIQRDADSFYTAARDAEAFEAQAPYLIWMLNCTQQFSSRISLSTNAIDARIRLQNTLVRGVFGVQANAVFEPALEPPQCPPDDDIMKDIDTQIGAADIRYWFKSEVWRLIGSDVLRKNHVEWD